MKRYIIILAAVLSALVSCKKHNTDENTSDTYTISFHD